MGKSLLDSSILNLDSLLTYMPDLYLLLNDELKIVAVSDAYAKATNIIKDKVIGRHIFDVFPENPEDLTSNGVSNLRHSLERVLQYKQPDTMAVQKYDILVSQESDKFEIRYWSPINSPILDKNNNVKYIIHRVQDVTEFIERYQTNNPAANREHEIELIKRSQEIQAANEKLREAEERLRVFVESCKDYELVMLDTQGHVISWNKGAERIKGYTADEIIGQHFSIFYPKEAVEKNYPQFELESAEKNGRFEDEGWRIKKDGSQFWANVVITPMYDSRKLLLGFGKVTQDLTERKKIEEEIVFLSHHDALTNLYNRFAFTEKLKKELMRSEQNKTSLAILMLDLDNFKSVNDTFGHHIGDRLLREVGKHLLASVRKEDAVARLGGDEFVILITDIDRENLKDFARNLIKRFNKPFQLDGHYFKATVSIGIALSPESGVDVTTLVQNADIAMYAVKEIGRNNFQFYSEDINSEFTFRSKLESLLSTAIDHDQLFLVYQPQYNLPDKKIIGVEALIRWEHPELGVIHPVDFIPIAEKNGFIVHIGEWVLRNAFTQFMEWQTKRIAPNNLKLSINVSAKQLIMPNFLKTFATILNETKMSPDKIEFELAEKAVLTSTDDLDSVIEQLRNLGVTISIDDFGSGYSTLNRLKELPVSSLKIDKSFINILAKDPNDAVIVKSIIDLGNKLGLNVIPEGVETEEQLNLLMKYHCRLAQGFYFGKEPLRVKEMTELFKKS
jgi:diguanylate cyclase (GGDEF)-like protein/PAS domain S-box-containing protein